jgi:transcriptional regulator with XRE-family HTH domain
MIRKEKGLTLAYVGRGSDSDGNLKGHLSNIEHGRVSPTLAMLQKIAKNMEIDLPYLATLPGASRRQALIDRTRWMTEEEARELLDKLGPAPPCIPPKRNTWRHRVSKGCRR